MLIFSARQEWSYCHSGVGKNPKGKFKAHMYKAQKPYWSNSTKFENIFQLYVASSVAIALNCFNWNENFQVIWHELIFMST